MASERPSLWCACALLLRACWHSMFSLTVETLQVLRHSGFAPGHASVHVLDAQVGSGRLLLCLTVWHPSSLKPCMCTGEDSGHCRAGGRGRVTGLAVTSCFLHSGADMH